MIKRYTTKDNTLICSVCKYQTSLKLPIWTFGDTGYCTCILFNDKPYYLCCDLCRIKFYLTPVLYTPVHTVYDID